MSERTSAYDQYAPQLEELASLPQGDPRRDRLTAELTDAFRPVARNIARRFSRRGESVDDLEQVAAIGLLHADWTFDPDGPLGFLAGHRPLVSATLHDFAMSFGMTPYDRAREDQPGVHAGTGRQESPRLGPATRR